MIRETSSGPDHPMNQLIYSLSRGHYKVRTPTYRRTIKDVIKVVNRHLINR